MPFSLAFLICSCSDGRKLERLQERGLRAVYRDRYASYQQLLETAELPKLLNRHLQDICILMCKVKYNLCPTYICNLFNNHNSSYSLRHSDFSIPWHNTVTYGKHSLRSLGPRLWRTLTPDLTSAKTLNIFKSRIRKNDISSMIDGGCKRWPLCTSQPFNFTILSQLF